MIITTTNRRARDPSCAGGDKAGQSVLGRWAYVFVKTFDFIWAVH